MRAVGPQRALGRLVRRAYEHAARVAHNVAAVDPRGALLPGRVECARVRRLVRSRVVRVPLNDVFDRRERAVAELPPAHCCRPRTRRYRWSAYIHYTLISIVLYMHAGLVA